MQEFKASRIPGSRFFDVDKISDPNTDLPHMLPSAAAFAAAADALGISADDQVVCLLLLRHHTCPRGHTAERSSIVSHGDIPDA